jgi:hypothetical protein
MTILHSIALNPSLHFRVMTADTMQLSYKVCRVVFWQNKYCQDFGVTIDGVWIGNWIY